MKELIHQYQSMIHFVFIYILEAHASNEWPIREYPISFCQHTCVDDKRKAAILFEKEMELPSQVEILVDNELNEFNSLYSSWPTRIWILHNGQVALKNMPDNENITLEEVKDWLVKYRAQLQRCS